MLQPWTRAERARRRRERAAWIAVARRLNDTLWPAIAPYAHEDEFLADRVFPVSDDAGDGTRTFVFDKPDITE